MLLGKTPGAVSDPVVHVRLQLRIDNFFFKGLVKCLVRLLSKTPSVILVFMAAITEVEKLALDLPERQRAVLAAHLLGSLPSVLHDEDEGIAEALRRDAELDANPSAGLSLEQLDQQIERRRS